MGKGRVNRRAGGPVHEVLADTLPRPFADTTKPYKFPEAIPDRSFPGGKRNVVLVRGLPARGYSPRSGQIPFPAKRLFTDVERRRAAKNVLRFVERLKADPRVSYCVRRKERREVLFAMKRAGFGGSARKKTWRRTYNSQWRC